MNEQDAAAIDRLIERRHNLAQHMAAQENEIVKTGQRLAGLDETIYRLRKAAATSERTV